jgi:type VI secretion system protein ImpF
MAKVDPQQVLKPSILDRLIDAGTAGTAARRGYSLEQAEEAVRRDLEDLLNTRQSNSDVSEDFVEINRSILTYGLPDLTSLQTYTPQQRQQIGRVLEAIITRFEPRLRDVRATMKDADNTGNQTVRFRIDARLCLEPAPPVAFDTILEVTTGHYTVRPSEP